MEPQYSIVAFSHLRWNFVYQRPQHLLSRLAATRPVFFVEEPELDRQRSGPLGAEQSQPNVTVLPPTDPGRRPRAFMPISSALEPLIAELAAELEGDHRAGLALHAAWRCRWPKPSVPHAIVYDCMDELSLFLGAPPRAAERESRAAANAPTSCSPADRACTAPRRTATPTCTASRAASMPAHFRQAPAERTAGGRPTRRRCRTRGSGFFGVIDERFDLPLLDRDGRAAPGWQIVLVGPVVKIDPATCRGTPTSITSASAPTRSCRRYLAGWDVCLLPFARNDATQFISPTKTLEYMAAELPIVSTPITDVAEPYGDIVYLGEHAGGVPRGLRGGLAAGAAERAGSASRCARCWPAPPGTSPCAMEDCWSAAVDRAGAGRMASRSGRGRIRR